MVLSYMNVVDDLSRNIIALCSLLVQAFRDPSTTCTRLGGLLQNQGQSAMPTTRPSLVYLFEIAGTSGPDFANSADLSIIPITGAIKAWNNQLTGENESMDKDEVIESAKQLRRDDELEESQALLLELLEEYPDDPVVLFEVGGSYDVMGMEPDAIPYYEQAIEAGLEGDALQECLVCLGSSYRVTGQAEEAVEILEKAVERFPERNSGRVFLALAHYSNGQYEDAVRLLLDLLTKTTSDEEILVYADTLDYYKDNLDETWETDEE